MTTQPPPQVEQTELLPCPFCGGEARRDHDPGYRWWTTECTRCPCLMTEGGVHSAEQANEFWNRRASMQAQAPEVAEPLTVSTDSNTTMPALPKPKLRAGPIENREWFDADQMREYAQAAIAALQREVDELRADKARMDWAEANPSEFLDILLGDKDHLGLPVYLPVLPETLPTGAQKLGSVRWDMRAAIDAASKAEVPNG